MGREPSGWERMELERLLDNAIDEGADSDSSGGVLVTLAAFLGMLGYAVFTYGPDAITLAKKILYVGH